jgi:hypothetical protein
MPNSCDCVHYHYIVLPLCKEGKMLKVWILCIFIPIFLVSKFELFEFLFLKEMIGRTFPLVLFGYFFSK